MSDPIDMPVAKKSICVRVDSFFFILLNLVVFVAGPIGVMSESSRKLDGVVAHCACVRVCWRARAVEGVSSRCCGFRPEKTTEGEVLRFLDVMVQGGGAIAGSSPGMELDVH